MNLDDDLKTRWLPSAEQMKMADALLAAGYTAERNEWIEDGEIRPVALGRGERGVYTAHLLVNKEFGFWTEDVELVFLDGVFLSRKAVQEFLHAAAKKHYREHNVKLTGGWAWHPRVTEAAVFEDIMSQFPDKDEKNSFLIWEDDLGIPGLRTFPDREAAMTWLVENTEEDRVSAIYAEILDDGVTMAEHVILSDLDWPGPDYIAGDWLLVPTATGETRYKKGYAAGITGEYSYGVSAEVTEEVLRVIAEDQPILALGEDRIEWRPEDGKRAAYLISDGFDSGEQRLGPNEFGFYNAPGWAWTKVKANECFELVGDEDD